MKTSVYSLFILALFLACLAFPSKLDGQGYKTKHILFDDFSYKSVEFPIAGDSSLSIFGKNIWTTDSGTVSSRLWHRYNVGDPKLDTTCGVSLIDEGFSIFIKRGFKNSMVGPVIPASFKAKGGTYAGRIWFDSLHKEDKIIQAFWLGPLVYYSFDSSGLPRTYWSECDIELNNWFNIFDANKRARIHAHNHAMTGKNSGSVFNCQCGNGADTTYFKECVELYQGKPLLEGRWFEAMIVVDTVERTVKYSLYSPDWDSAGSRIWVGGGSGAADFGKPIILKDYFPRDFMVPIFSMHCDSSHNDYTFNADWFYYSERTDISFDDIHKDINEIRKDGISRLNTTGLELASEERSTEPGNMKIIGADTAFTCQTSTWSLYHTNRRSTAYNIIFKYRIFKNGQPENWNNIYDIDFSFQPTIGCDSIEFFFSAKDVWEDYRDSASKIVLVSSAGCPSPELVYTIEGVDSDIQNKIEIIRLNVIKQEHFSICVYDVLGNFVCTLLDSEPDLGRNDVAFDLNPYSAGIYFVSIKAGGQNQVLKVYK